VMSKDLPFQASESGPHRGEMDAATDRAYAEAVTSALAAGVNFIDTSLNYRNPALRQVIGARKLQRARYGACRGSPCHRSRENLGLSTVRPLDREQ